MFFSQVLNTKCSASSLPEIETPLGNIAFSVKLNESDVTAKFSGCFDLGRGEKLFRYELPEAFFELLIFRNNFKLLPHQRIKDCLTCAIRLAAKRDVQLRFAGAWSGNSYPDGGGEPGERLMAMTWESSQFVVSLGTGDIEWHYPYAGKSFPLRWKQFLPEYELPEYMNEQTIHFIEQVGQRGLMFEPPGLMSGEACQLAFAVAWADFAENDISTWLSVDYAHEIKRDDFLPFRPFRRDEAST